MRASYIKDNILALNLLGDDVAKRIRADLPAGLLDTIVSASRLAWLPLDVDVALTDAVARAVGDEGVRRWSAAAVKSSLAGPLLRPFLSAAVALFGLTPAALFRRAPIAYQQVYRDCGPLLVSDVEPGHAKLRFVALPHEMFASPSYLTGTAGTFEGVIEVAGAKGSVTLTKNEPEAVYVATWSTAPSRAA